MSHGRAQIRAQVATLLDANATLTGRVYVNPQENLQPDQLPAVVVTTPAETVEALPGKRERTLTVRVECLGSSASTIDLLDDYAAAVENALESDSLGGIVTHWALVSTEHNFVRDQAQQIGSARLTFQCLYHTSLTDPETII